MRSVLLTSLLTLLVALVACGSDDPNLTSVLGGPPPDAGQPTTDIVFSGVSTVDALNPEEILVAWPDAVLLPNLTGAAGIRYRIYRGTSVTEAQLSTTILHETNPGTTAWVDTTIDAFATYFYKVVAVDTDERTSLSLRVTSGRTPASYEGGGFDYDTDVLPLWSMSSPINPTETCLSCHTTPGTGSLDLSTREGAAIGIGTQQSPNSFIIAFDGDATWAEFLSRMSSAYNLVDHAPWLSAPTTQNPVPGNPSESYSLMDAETPLRTWANEGGTLIPDVFPPTFAIGGVANSGSYYGEFINFDTIELTFPHADDPETLPPSGNRAGQIEYAIYGGPSTNEINWDQPIALAFVSLAAQNDPEVVVQVNWPFGPTAILVVRPIDSAGRSVGIDPLTYNPATATLLEQELIRQRMRNQNANEREIVVIR